MRNFIDRLLSDDDEHVALWLVPMACFVILLLIYLIAG